MPVDNRNSRRLVRVLVSTALIEQWVREGFELRPVRCISGLPLGAKLHSVAAHDWRDPTGYAVALTFAHPSFAEVPNGEEPPILNPVYEEQARQRREHNRDTAESALGRYFEDNGSRFDD